MIAIIQNGKMNYISSNGRQYDGEKIPGDLKNWSYTGSNPNEILRDTYDVLCQRATSLYHTHPPVSSAINKRTAYAIGSGLVFRSQPDWEILEIKRDYAKDWSMRFQKLIHYISLLTNFYEKQSVLYRTAKIHGDALLFFDRTEDGLFDVIETGGDYINFRAPGTTLGIVHDSAMRRTGLKLTDGLEVNFIDSNKDQNVIQFYDKMMARQLRGYPLAYKIISQAKNNDRWWDATLARAVMETIILGVHKDDDSGNSLYEQSNDLAAIAKSEAQNTSTTTVTKESALSDQTPGGMYSVSSKGGIEFTDLKTPSNNFDKMQNAYIDIVGMATDTPPEVVISRYSTSYTAHKGAFNDFIRSFMNDRKLFSNKVNKIFVIEAAKYLFLSGMIEMPHPDFFVNPIIREATVAGNYLGPVPGHINPLQEVSAKEKAVNNAFDLRSNVALNYGNEWDNFVEEWTQEEEAFKKVKPEKQAGIIAAELKKYDDVRG